MNFISSKPPYTLHQGLEHSFQCYPFNITPRNLLGLYRYGGQSVSTEKYPAHTPCDKALIETSWQTCFCQITQAQPRGNKSGSLLAVFRHRLNMEWLCESWLEEKKKKKKKRFNLLLTLLFSTQQENLKTAHFTCFVSGLRRRTALCSETNFRISKYITNQKFWLSTDFSYN